MEKTEGLTQKEFEEFLSASGDEQWRILLVHAQKNEKVIRVKKSKAAGNCGKNEVEAKIKGKTE